MSEANEHKMLRLCYVVLFYVIYNLTDVVLVVIAVAQTLLNLFGEGPSETLKDFGASLGIYVKQITEYLSYNHQRKPYPFSDWPVPEQKAD